LTEVVAFYTPNLYDQSVGSDEAVLNMDPTFNTLSHTDSYRPLDDNDNNECDNNDCDYDNSSNNNNEDSNGKDSPINNDDDDHGLANCEDVVDGTKKNINEPLDPDTLSKPETDGANETPKHKPDGEDIGATDKEQVVETVEFVSICPIPKKLFELSLGSDIVVNENDPQYDMTMSAIFDGDFGEEIVFCNDCYKDESTLSTNNDRTIPKRCNKIDIWSHEIWSLLPITAQEESLSLFGNDETYVALFGCAKCLMMNTCHGAESLIYIDSPVQHYQVLPLDTAGLRAAISPMLPKINSSNSNMLVLHDTTLWQTRNYLVIELGNNKRITMPHHLWQSFICYFWSYWICQQGINSNRALNTEKKTRLVDASRFRIRANSETDSPRSHQACTSPGDIMGSLVQTFLDDTLNQPSLTTQGQVQVYRQNCLTMHNGEPVVFVVEKALVTTGPRVGSKHVPKNSLEWGDNNRTRPDFR
jgi:hypothetical protein